MVTEEQAAENRRNNRNPKRPRPAIPALIPVKKPAWWEGVKSGRYPKPTKALGKRITAWPVDSIRNLIQQVGREASALNFDAVRSAESAPGRCDMNVGVNTLPPAVLMEPLTTESEALTDPVALKPIRRAEKPGRVALKSTSKRLPS
jgi:predicted DNA-binding transcriptional regulator AlpA